MRKKIFGLRLFFCLVLVSGFISVFAQQTTDFVYINAEELTLIGKVGETQHYFHRVDTARYNNMPTRVKQLFTNSAGLAIAFKTNSNIISARWSTARTNCGNNMTDIMARGLDLYIKRDGKWVFAAVGRPGRDAATMTSKLIQDMEDGEKECLLYLPLYDETKKLEIGISENSYIEAIPNPFRKKVIIYGSSITQGASATRAGMAYPARMGRSLGVDFVNFGLSGNGKMHKLVADMIKDMKADAYILDCAANPSPDEISERTANLVSTIRKYHPDAPIVMIESVIRETGNFDVKVRNRVAQQNRNFKEEFKKLKASGIEDLFYIEGSLLGTDHEGTVDGVHPNDIGFDRMLQIIEPKVKKILKKYGI